MKKSLEDRIVEKLRGKKLTFGELKAALEEDAETTGDFNEIRFNLTKTLNKLMRTPIVKRETCIKSEKVYKYGLVDNEGLIDDTDEMKRLLDKIDLSNITMANKELFIMSLSLEARRIWEESYESSEGLK